MKTRSTTIGINMFTKLFSWSLWYIGILIFIHLLSVVIASKANATTLDLMGFSYTSSWGTVFVISSIIAAYTFMPFYVKHGITRRNFYTGYAIAGLMFSTSITLMYILDMGIIKM